MAVQTIKATIQMRKGAEQNFDPSKMTAGEWAVSTDSKKVWMCFAPGIVRRMATYEAFEQDMREIQLILATCQNIQAAVERFMQLAQQHSTQAEEWSVTSKSWAVGGTGTREGENTNNSQFWSNQSKAEADRAKEEADRAAAIANFDIDSELNETSVNPVQNKVITNFLANLKSVAFTGKYSDLTEKLPLINNYLTTEEEVGAADAKLAADLKKQIDSLNNNLTNNFEIQAAKNIATTILAWLTESDTYPRSACLVSNNTLADDRPGPGEYTLLAIGAHSRASVLAFSYPVFSTAYMRGCYNGVWRSNWIKIV